MDSGGNLKNLLDRIEKLNEIGIRLSTEKDTARLLETILLGAKDLTNADGGTLYSVTADNSLKFEIMRTESLGFAMGGTNGVEIPFAPIPMYDDQGQPNLKMVATYAAIKDEIVNIPDAYKASGFDFSGTRIFDQKTGFRSKSFLTVPLKNQEDVIIGVLQLLNAIDAESGEVVSFSDEDQRLVASLASQAAVALTKERLIQDLKKLFEALIQLLATAIDEKSPTTGQHCRRVPILTMMLADAVSVSTEGHLAPFVLDEKKRYELEVAAWLHDCGKITTPEHVVGKATKLETIYDRIEAVDTRFEVIKRDAEIAWLRDQLRQHGVVEKIDEGALKEIFAGLDKERDFLRRCNTGGEFMPSDQQQRVATLAESMRWRGPDGTTRPLLDADEINNLIISRGTLTDAERDVINNHVVASIKILESLPFPQDMQHVPEYAGGHHERLDGNGYPAHLVEEQIPLQARIIAVADVFEALTAKDRSYKKGKTLSETLRIMAFMTKDRHFDADIFAVFVKERIYLDYARKYMNDEQIDVVDHDTILQLFTPMSLSENV
ncbi:MAG: GAF domain-containing protein [Desulfuromonadaceae bacterium]|nr:GAF domain-containing protein [Desulfuromonadaceae bacterium]